MKTLKDFRKIGALALTAAGCLFTAAIGRAATPASHHRLDNGLLTAEFERDRLVRIEDLTTRRALGFTNDSASLTVGGKALAVPGLVFTGAESSPNRLKCSYAVGPGSRLDVVYELKSGWRFLSKQLVLTLAAGTTNAIEAVEVFRASLTTPVASEHQLGGGSRGVFLRLGEGEGRFGAIFAVQNPFLKWQRQDGRVSLAYEPAMEWRAAYGPFESDRACIGLYELSGQEIPARNVPEWKYLPDPGNAFDDQPKLDWAEVQALTQCVEAFVMQQPTKSLKVHVPWCENDYQVDIGTPAGREEYKRIIGQTAAVGCEDMLFTPGNNALAPLSENRDAWGWENVLWLGLGQKIRQGEWNPAKDPIPPSIQEMLDYSNARKIKLVAYAYPTLGWKQNPEWTAWCGGKTGGYVGVDTGVRSFQDWFVDLLVAFQKRTGISGYCFDHWWIAYEAKDGNTPTSKYAQWYGCRRILEELRRRVPDIVIDGRQQYQWFGPWTWLGGSYPHPTTNDEQPGSFENFPDLHFSRVSGDRQRWAAWWYRFEQFTPLVLTPGYMTHQTPRNNAQGECVRDRAFRARDFDYLGWRYSVLSSIGTAPFNNVVDYLPARDPEEFRQFRPEDQRWMREWLAWTDQHRDLLRNLRPIIGPPVLGRVDGTAAIDGDHGFIFLFNPNYRELKAEFRLDASIGLKTGEGFVFRELYPQKGRLLGKPYSGVWNLGDVVSLPVKGPEARVLELVPAAKIERPALLNVEGKAFLQGRKLILTDVTGGVGSRAEASVLMPKNAVDTVIVNGVEAPNFAANPSVLSLPVAFAGTPFGHCQQVGQYDRHFAGGQFRAGFTIPQRVFDQLAARRQAWPIAYTDDDLRATWLGSDRLLLYVHIADPDDKWEVGLKIDGQPMELKRAYSDVYPLGRERTFTGFYADVSKLKPDTRHDVELTLPALQPGQFQGLFFENVEAEFTSRLVR